MRNNKGRNNESVKVRNNESTKLRKNDAKQRKSDEKQRRWKQRNSERAMRNCERAKRNNETAKQRLCKITKGRCETARLRNNERARMRKGDAKERDFKDILFFETAEQREGEMTLSGHHTYHSLLIDKHDVATLKSAYLIRCCCGRKGQTDACQQITSGQAMLMKCMSSVQKRTITNLL